MPSSSPAELIGQRDDHGTHLDVAEALGHGADLLLHGGVELGIELLNRGGQLAVALGVVSSVVGGVVGGIIAGGVLGAVVGGAIVGAVVAAAGRDAQHHSQGKQQRDPFFHRFILQLLVFGV